MIFQDIFDETHTLSGKPVDIKQHNQRLVITLLSSGRVFPAGDLAEIANLSKTTISKILVQLCKKGIVCSVGKGDSTTEGGKKPELFTINANLAVSLVISLYKSNKLTCAATDLCGKVLYQKDYLMPEAIAYEELISLMNTGIYDAYSNLGLSEKTVCALAIAYNGVVNTETGEILYPMRSASAVFRPLKKDLAEKLTNKFPILIDNACHFSGYAELLFEENKEFDNLVIISCGESVNGCILTHQRFMPGNHKIAGEFGHLIIEPDSPARCYCGCNGCLESLISERGVLSMGKRISVSYPFSATASRVIDGSISAEDLFRAAYENDMYAKEVLHTIVKYLTILIRSISSLINVPKVIIQGMYARIGDDFLSEIRARLEECNKLYIHNDLEVEFSSYSQKGAEEDEYACIRGASYYISKSYFEQLVETANDA